MILRGNWEPVQVKYFQMGSARIGILVSVIPKLNLSRNATLFLRVVFGVFTLNQVNNTSQVFTVPIKYLNPIIRDGIKGG